MELKFLDVLKSSDSPAFLNNSVLYTKISKQLPDTDSTQNFMSASETTETALNGIFIAALILNLLMAGTGSLEYLVNMINSLQLVIHLPILHILVPSNVGFFFTLILPFVMFDIFDSEWTTEVIFEFN